MIRALWTAASGMQSQQLNIDVIANNLANVNTTGFKKSRADFQDLMYQTLKTTGAPSTSSTQIPAGIQVGLAGSRPAQRIGLVGGPHVQRVPVGVGVARDGAPARVTAGPGDPDGDLAAIGDQDGVHGDPFGKRVEPC